MIVTVNDALAVLFATSLAVTTTLVVPAGNDEPDGGTAAADGFGQLSETVGAGKLTTAGTLAVEIVTLAGAVTVGGWVSLTVIQNWQVGCGAPEALAVTSVDPTG